MTRLTSSVGVGGQKNRHDIAVVQLLLRVLTNPDTKKPFYNFPPSGRLEHDHQLFDAIRAFQKTYKLAAAPKTAAPPLLVVAGPGARKGPPAPPRVIPAPIVGGGANGSAAAQTAGADKEGLVDVNSATFLKLVAEAVKVDSKYDRLRALPNTRYLYLEMTDVQLQTALKAIGDSELDDDFKDTVLEYVNDVYREHKIALRGWDSRTSYRRSFKEQHIALQQGHSQANPGESLHNYGLAMDVGYTGLVMILEDGDSWKITDEDDFQDLAKHYHDFNRQNALFKVRNDIWAAPRIAGAEKLFKGDKTAADLFGGTGTLFRILLHHVDDDPNHFQVYNQFPDLYPDDQVDMQRSLAEHLSSISTDGVTVKWVNVGHNHHYACDFGLGVKPIDVGTADEIWSGHPKLSKPQYVHAQKQKDPNLKDADVSDKDYQDVLKDLTTAFSKAEARWQEWEPLRSDGTSLG